MIETIDTGSAKVVGVKLSGKLHDEDYRQFVPAMEALLTTEGKIRLFVEFQDFHGWDMHAAWDDFKFGVKHYSDFERIAMVGDRRWEKWMASFCKPFTRAKVKFFESSQVEAAWQWLREEGQEKTEEAEPSTEASDKPDDFFPWFGP